MCAHTDHDSMTPSQDMSTDGLPLTFQLVGNRLDEVLLCQLGHAFEGAVGRQRVPWLPPRVVSAVDAKL